MRTSFALCGVVLLCAVVIEARMAEKVSEDDNFVVYRIPVADLQSQASGHYEGMEPFHGVPGSSYGRSGSKSSSHSKSSSSSTGHGKGKGYGEGSSSAGSGKGYGSSSSGSGHGGGSSGHGSGYGGSGSGYGGSGSGYGSSGHGSGYGGSGSGHGGSGSGYGSSGHGSGYGGSGSGYGSSGHGSGYGGSGSGYGSSGHGTGYGGSGSGYGSGGHGSGYGVSAGGQAPYTPHESGSHGGSYDDEEADYPKVVTSTKTFTTNSAQDTGYQPQSQYRQIPDSVGDINFRLADYLKNTPGHEGSAKYSQKIFEDFMTANPGYRSGQGFNINEFTRSLNHGMGHKAPSYRSNHRFVPQASMLYPVTYGLRHAGFGLTGF